jgi:hypothetical protein
MKCKHDINYLIGNADGVLCRKCGKQFSSFATLKAELDADRAEQEAPKPVEPAADQTPAPETDTETQEKPKRGRKKKGEGA